MLLAILFACTGTKGDDTGESVDTADTDSDPDLVGDCTTEACGGDPVGSWTIGTTCWDDAPQPLDSEDCPTGTLTVTNVLITGSFEVTADGAYDSNFTSFEQNFIVHLPGECVSRLTCEELAGFMESSIPGVVCTDAKPDGCDCVGALSSAGDTDSGTWTTEGTSMTFVSDDGSDPETNDYCADSDELWVRFLGADGSEFGMLLTR